MCGMCGANGQYEPMANGDVGNRPSDRSVDDPPLIGWVVQLLACPYSI